jgi:hypothetical protein
MFWTFTKLIYIHILYLLLKQSIIQYYIGFIFKKKKNQIDRIVLKIRKSKEKINFELHYTQM